MNDVKVSLNSKELNERIENERQEGEGLNALERRGKRETRKKNLGRSKFKTKRKCFFRQKERNYITEYPKKKNKKKKMKK